MNKQKHEQAVKVLCESIEEARGKLTESELPPHDVCKAAIEGIVAKRGQSVLRKTPPVFREHPLGSLLGRYLDWHRGTGYLGSLYTIGWDAEMLEKASTSDPASYGDYWRHDKSRLFDHARLVAGIEGLGDKLDSLALVILKGQSRAAEAWSKALGRS